MSKAWLLVLGSKTFKDDVTVRRFLSVHLKEALVAGHDGIIVVHGAGTDVDRSAERWVEQNRYRGAESHRFPADWDGDCVETCKSDHRKIRQNGTTYCPAEGYNRNKRMVAHIAESTSEAACLAFYSKVRDDIVDDSAKRARHIGMRVVRLGVQVQHSQKVES
jgi:hypothetical protein